MTKNRPCAVVNAPFVIHGNPVTEKGSHPFAERNVALYGIFEIIQRLRKAVHIIDLFGFRRFLHKSTPCVPVRGDGKNCLRLDEFLNDRISDRTQSAGYVIILQRHHWAAVTREDDRHSFFVHNNTSRSLI